ncbi:MAG: SpoIIE family protein phosphatase [Gemmatimonadota bacterium]|nr:SpoIIE family protein phosphatase [Gemmatimonadota bacterium]
MTSDPVPRILVLSSRPDVLAAVTAVASSLDPPPVTTNLLGPPGDLAASDLVIVDVGEPAATSGFLRARLGTDTRFVALLDGAWIERFGDALAGDWFDYLFFPISAPELGLVWRRHVGGEPAGDISLDVAEDGRVRLSFPSTVSYQRPAVERIVEAGRHLAGLDSDAAFRVRVAVGEAVANAILYGSGDGKRRLVHLELRTSEDSLDISVRDEGAGFDPESVPDPTTGSGLEGASGRGLLLMRRVSDGMAFNDVGNEVTLSFKGSTHPVRRLVPVLSEFSRTTGLDVRLEHLRPSGRDIVHDGLGDHPEPDSLVTAEYDIADRERLVLTYAAPSAGVEVVPGAEGLLSTLLDAIVDTDEARERWIDRRLRRERVLAELEVARDLQLRLLPDAVSFRDLAEVSARCEPALSLGGDFYFLSRLSGGRLGVMLGDVSSHGPSAALIMALTLSAAALAARGDAGAADVLDGMRDQLMGALETTEMYMTLFYAVIDPERRAVTYANAGHPYAYRLSPVGRSRLEALDPPIGMGSDAGYREERLSWAPGTSTLLVFTDGLTADLVDPIADPGPALGSVLDADALEPERLVDALFADVPAGMRLDDRTALAVRP